MRITTLKFSAFVVLTMLAAPLVTAQQPQTSSECSFATYGGKQVDKKVRILAKPEPQYDRKELRKYGQSVIVLKAVFCGSGQVTDIKVQQGLSNALNEKAVEAARKIRF